jgi:SAM-dependent methyltransferase
LRLRDADPRLSDRLPTSPYDAHYLHQAVWAAERIFTASPPEHVDVGSELTFVGVLSAKLPVVFVDLRPLELEIANLRPMKGDVLALPFDDRSVVSMSCLHVVEHIGLGRYGDPLNPFGTRQALAELGRVLAPGGNLFLSLPIGVPRVCFNAHRIHDPREILKRMESLDLVEFSVVDDEGVLRREALLDGAARLRYGCGLFWFRGRR